MNKSRVKFGKISAVLRQNGFFAGLKIISVKLLQVVSGILRKPKGDIIFISGLTGAVAMYRTHNVAEELNKHKFKTSVLYEGDPFLIRKVKKAKVIILNRVTWSNKTQELLKQAGHLKQAIIYDTDDLTFDIKKFKQSEAYKNFNDVQKEQYEKTTGLEILQSKQLKAITTTTIFLAEKLKIFKKPVYVVKNKLSEQDLKLAVEARKNYLNRLHENSKEVRLGYFSGSSSHNKDFNVIVPALEVILDKYENVKLYSVGYLDVQSKFYKRFKKQIVQLPFVQLRKKHYENIAQININLASLEMNDFCQAKSELKFFEAGVMGIPTIAVNNQTFSEVITDGKDGLLAGTTSEWIDKLESLIRDRELRVKLGKNARQTVMKKHLTTSGGSEEYYKFLRDFLKR